MVLGSSEYECDLEYVARGTQKLTCAAKTTLVMPKKVTSGVVNASQYDEVLTVTDSPSTSALGFEGESDTEEASDAELDRHTGSNTDATLGFGSEGAPLLDSAANPPSFDEAKSEEAAPSPPHKDPSPVGYLPNQWSIEGKHQIHRYAKIPNEKGVMIRTKTIERRFFTGSLHNVPEVHALLIGHRLEWMARCVGCYSEEVVR